MKDIEYLIQEDVFDYIECSVEDQIGRGLVSQEVWHDVKFLIDPGVGGHLALVDDCVQKELKTLNE